MKTKFITDIKLVEGITVSEQDEIMDVCEAFSFRATEYYLSLIDWNDPDDPLRRTIIPHPEEMLEWGTLDSSREKDYTKLQGLQHKYGSTAVLLVSDDCAGQCRYCFRKRIFLRDDPQTVADLDAALDYISNHREITNVLLTGGDPLMLPTSRLEEIVAKLLEIEHVGTVRVGSKTPVFNPLRIVDDPALVAMFRKYSLPGRKLYLITHFGHPGELTDLAAEGISALQEAGAIVCNQLPLIRGVNDNPVVLAGLFNMLFLMGVAPYYLFQCRPAIGNRGYAVPVEEGYDIFQQAQSMVSGLAKRSRFLMSHATGKIEVMGKTAEHTYFKYHRAAEDVNNQRFLVCKRNPSAYWFDDYEEIPQG